MMAPPEQDLDRAGYLQTYLAKMLVDRRLEAAAFETAWHNRAVAEHVVTTDLKVQGHLALLREVVHDSQTLDEEARGQLSPLVRRISKTILDEDPLMQDRGGA